MSKSVFEANRSPAVPRRHRMAAAVAVFVQAIAFGAQAQQAAAPAIPVQGGADGQPPPASTSELAEVIVTATKRSENVRKVAGSVSALTEKQLEQMGAQTFGDYLATVPGVQFDQTSPQQSMISMRGITTSTIPQQNQQPTGVFFDEVSMTDPFDVVLVPDFDTFDMARVEVMRGPQGALFGSGALGGAVNFVPNHADPAGYDAQVETEWNTGRNGRIGYFAKGMFNLPVVKDTAALRVAAYDIKAPGYIDNLGTGQNDANNHLNYGGRVLGTWNLSRSTTLALTSFFERTDQDDTDYEYLGLGPYKNDSSVASPSTGRMNVDYLRLESDLGFAKLVGIGSYQYKYYSALYDATQTLADEAGSGLGLSVSQNTQLGNLIGSSPLGSFAQTYRDNLHGYSGELRLVSPASDRFEWLVGVFYSDRRERWGGGYEFTGLTSLLNNLIADLTPLVGSSLAGTLQQDTSLVSLVSQVKAVELAGYADLTYKFGPHWKLTAGGREYRNRIPGVNNTSGLIAVASYGSFSNTTTGMEKDTGFNPKVSLSWLPNNDDLFYILYSHGFSLGGFNILPPQPGVTFPRTYNSNKLLNFEAGAKTSWFHHRLLVDITPYYVYWHDIPLSLSAPGVPTTAVYLENVGDAHSYGVESAITAKLTRRLTLTNTATWSHAILASDFNPGNNQPVIPYGTPLPGTPKWQFSNLATYVWPMGDWQLHASVLNRYTGPSAPSIQYATQRQGNYDLVGIRGGFNWRSVGVEAFADNLLNRHAVTTNNYTSTSGSYLYLAHPRVVGVKLGWSMD